MGWKLLGKGGMVGGKKMCGVVVVYCCFGWSVG